MCRLPCSKSLKDSHPLQATAQKARHFIGHIYDRYIPLWNTFFSLVSVAATDSPIRSKQLTSKVCMLNLLLVAMAIVLFPAPGGPVKRTLHGGKGWVSLEQKDIIS